MTYPRAHYLQSQKFNFLLKFYVKILCCKHYFSPLSTFVRKGKDPDPYLWVFDPDPGAPKTCGSGSPTLKKRKYFDVPKSCLNDLLFSAWRWSTSARRPLRWPAGSLFPGPGSSSWLETISSSLPLFFPQRWVKHSMQSGFASLEPFPNPCFLETKLNICRLNVNLTHVFSLKTQNQVKWMLNNPIAHKHPCIYAFNLLWTQFLAILLKNVHLNASRLFTLLAGSSALAI